VTPTPRRAWLWPVGLAALLAASAGANLAFVVVATRDPSFAVVPDYYTKALDWDRTLAQEAHNRGLGWSLSVTTDRSTRPGQIRLVVGLADATGVALDDAIVSVEALHGARAAELVSVTLTPAGRGRYVADLPLRRAGLWELRFRVSRAGDLFTSRLVRDLPGAS